jgi:hypothetical protein
VGAEKIDGHGYFYQPTVLSDVPNEAELRYEEIFGPVAPIFSFDSEEEAVAAANDTQYGLVSYVYTRDLATSSGRCAWLRTSRQAWSALTKAWSLTPLHLSAELSNQASAARAVMKALKSTLRQSTWRSTFLLEPHFRRLWRSGSPGWRRSGWCA